jgi:hypothetical protein
VGTERYAAEDRAVVEGCFSLLAAASGASAVTSGALLGALSGLGRRAGRDPWR